MYPTMMKLGTVIPYLKKIQKNMNHAIHPLRFKYCFNKQGYNFGDVSKNDYSNA